MAGRTVFYADPDLVWSEKIVRIANAAVAEGAPVEWHTDGIQVVEAATSTPMDELVGVAATTAAAGEQVEIHIRGVFNALCEGGTVDVDAGDGLIVSAAAAGEFQSTGLAYAAADRFKALGSNTTATATLILVAKLY